MNFNWKVVGVLFFITLNSFSQVDNPLIGNWFFLEGTSNGKRTFLNEVKRIKHYSREGVFYVSNEINLEKEITFGGKYRVFDASNFEEILFESMRGSYKYKIINDTLKFEGILLIPLENLDAKEVFLKEKWLKIDN